MPFFKELAGSPVETFMLEGMKAQRRLLCAFEDRYALVGTLLGGASPDQPQMSYPGQPAVVASRVRVEPFEKRPDNQGTFDNLTSDLNSYSGQYVEVVVQYDLLGDDGQPPRPPGIDPSLWITYRRGLGREHLILPAGAVQWSGDPSGAASGDAVPVLRIPITEHFVTWHRVVSPPWSAIRACTGAVNDGLFLGASAETLLFAGAKADRRLAGLDDQQQALCGWRVTYLFREKTIQALGGSQQSEAVGWNHGYRVETGVAGHWEKLIDQGGNTLYPAVDFGAMFRPEE
jgi:hypothetical protein